MYASVNPVTMGGGGFCYSMIPFINHFYKDNEEKRREALARHVKYFSTTIPMASFVMGIAGSMEKENSEKPDFDAGSINSIKLSLMGPLAGIGDTLFWVVIPTIWASIASPMALEGNATGIILWTLFAVALTLFRLKFFEWGYTLGTRLITELKSTLQVLTDACSILGLTVVGALIPSVISVKVPMVINFATGTSLSIQEQFDKIMPCMIPVLLTFICYKLLGKKKVSMTTLVFAVLIVSIAGSALGILG